eukprot:gene12859-27114_t
MAQNFSITELMSLYRSKNKPSKFSLPSKIVGHNLLKKMEKLVYLTRSRPLNQIEILHENESRRTIIICLVIVDKLYHEHIWKDWIKQAETIPNCPYRAKLVIHAKHPDAITSPWVKAATLKTSLRPEWNSPDVIRAMLACLQEGLKDPSAGRFVFAT